MKNNRMAWVGGVALVAVIALALVLALVSREAAIQPAQAQSTTQDGTSGIAVGGTGIALVKPDVVRLEVGLELRAATVTDAQKQAADKAQQITDALKKAGIKEEDIKTVDYSIRPNYTYRNNEAPVLNGYIVTNRLSVTIRDVKKAGEVIDAAGSAGATLISSIQFTLENNAEALKQARNAAMDDARKKADQLAAAGKVNVGSVVRIVDLSQNVGPMPVNVAPERSIAPPAAAPALQTTIQNGQFQVIVNVQVTYSIK